MKVREKAFSNYLLKEVEDITTSIENACGLNRIHWFAKNSRQRECVVCRAIFSKMKAATTLVMRWVNCCEAVHPFHRSLRDT